MSAAPNSSTPRRFALASRRVVLPDGMRPAVVVIEGERIAEFLETSARNPKLSADFPIEDLGDLVIAPGVIDAHVHVNEPGRTEWEGFETATKAAAAGGVTTIVDMPLNSSPVTTTVAALDAKRHATAGKCWVDVGFYGGVIPGNADQIEPLLNAGVMGIKAFLCHSGLDEFPNATLADLQAVAPILARHNRLLLVHAELTDAPAPKPKSAKKYLDYLATRPPQWEADAIRLLIRLACETNCHVHIVHLANGDALRMIRAAKSEAVPITVETCPHYLHFAADKADSLEQVELFMELEDEFDLVIPDDAAGTYLQASQKIPDSDPRYKCAPPIRERRHQEMLWLGLQHGLIDTIGSDHSPCPPEMKNLEAGDFMNAWGGIASLQLTLPIVWTNASKRGIPLEKIFAWLSANPAKLVGMENRKGRIAAGFDADLIVFDPDSEWIVRGDQLHHRHKLTPYDGVRLQGQIRRTYLRGSLIFNEQGHVGTPAGRLLSPNKDQSFASPSISGYLNGLGDAELRAALLKCCSCERWVDRMMAERPFNPNDQVLLTVAAEKWWMLDREDWLEAFAAHPKIGDIDSLRAKFANTKTWAGGEQSGVSSASQATLERLAQRNREYEARFGYIFIVCATGKSADEMLTILESRLPNDPQTELRIAAGEQLKITELRLKKLVDQAKA